MSIKFFATLLLAASLAACKPIASPHVLRDLGAQQDALIKSDICASPGSAMIAALAALEARAQGEPAHTLTDKSSFVTISANGRDDDNREDNRAKEGEKAAADAVRKKAEDEVAKQLLLQGVNQALLSDQKDNAAANEMDNVLRAVTIAQREPEKSTVILVVQEVKVSIELEIQVDDTRKETKKLNVSVFKQEVVVANRGKQETETVLIYDPRTLTAADIAAQPEATATANVTKPEEASATQTIAAVIYDAKPTHSKTIEDPAASMRAAFEAALEDRQSAERRAEDVELSIKIAVEIKVEAEDRNERNRKDRNGDDRNDDQDGEDREREREKDKQQEAEQRKQQEAEQRKQQEAEQSKQDQERESEAQRQDQQNTEQSGEDA